MRRLILICVGMMVSICVDAELSIVHYERAYAFIYQRLYHIKDVPFKDIVFAIDYVGDTHGSKNSGIGWYVFVDLGQTIDYMKHFHPTNPEVSPHDKKNAANTYRNIIKYPHANPNAKLFVTHRDKEGELHNEEY